MKKLPGYQKGVNLGGWLSQGKLTKEHLDTFITKKDIEAIARWGCDHIRLPVDFENIENADGSVKADGYTYIDNCISWCREYKLNMVLDLHKAYGYTFDNPEYSADFFDSTALQDRFINTWDNLSKHFAKDSDIVMFEMLNEVTRFEVIQKWNEIGLRCIKTIRKNAPTAKILFGGVQYSSVHAVKYLPEPVDENIVYNIHCYEPMLFTHQTACWCKGMPTDFHIGYPDSLEKYKTETIKIASSCPDAFVTKDSAPAKLGVPYFEELFSEAVKIAEERNVALYCGEYGVIDTAKLEDTLNWYNDIHTVFEKYGIGRAAWTYKDMNFGLSGEHYKPVIEKIIKLL